MNKGRILAIDYGEKNIGLAISDEDQKISLPLKNYRRKSIVEDINYIKELVEKRKIIKLVIGNPLNFKREESEMSGKVRDFIEKLREKIKIEIELFDETFTTKEAEYVLREFGFKEKKMKGKKDSIAASFLLSSYLESLK